MATVDSKTKDKSKENQPPADLNVSECQKVQKVPKSKIPYLVQLQLDKPQQESSTGGTSAEAAVRESYDDDYCGYQERAYGPDIIRGMRLLENERKLPSGYLAPGTQGKRIGVKSRATVIDWLVQVQHYLRLTQETLYECVFVFDSFMSLNPKSVHVEHYQLAAVASLFIAAKYEERFPPEVRELVRLTDNSCTRKDVLRMENIILGRLRFTLVMPQPLTYLDAFLRTENDHEKRQTLSLMCSYLIDVCLAHAVYTRTPCSLLVSAVLCLALTLCHGEEEQQQQFLWDEGLERRTGYTASQLAHVIITILDIIMEAQKSKTGAYLKYSSASRYKKVSKSEFFSPELLAKVKLGFQKV